MSDDNDDNATIGALSALNMSGSEGGDEALPYVSPGLMRPELQKMYQRGDEMLKGIDFSGAAQRQRDAVNAKRAAIQRGREALLGRQPDNIEILLALAKGFGSPTRTGSFAETLGNVAGEALPAVSRMNAAKAARDERLMDYETSMAGVEGEGAKLEYDQLMRRAEAARKLQADAMKIASAEEQNRLRIEAKKETASLIASLKDSKDDGFQPLSQAVDLSEEEAKALSDRLGINVRPGPTKMAFNRKTREMFPIGAAYVKPEKERKLIPVPAGTYTNMVDPETGEVVSRIRTDVQGKEMEEQLGQTRGKQLVEAPKALATAQDTLQVVKQLSEHKGLNDMLGVSGIAMRNLPGSKAAGALSLHDQVTAKAFLNVFETLKGAGAITDTEGTKGTSAILRLKLSLSPSEYREAIKEFKEVVEKGMRKAERDAAEYYSLQLRRSPPGGN